MNIVAPAPVNPWRILAGDDPTLVDDTLVLFTQLTERMGYAGLGAWLLAEHPYLCADHVTPLRRWWVLQRQWEALTAAGERAR